MGQASDVTDTPARSLDRNRIHSSFVIPYPSALLVQVPSDRARASVSGEPESSGRGGGPGWPRRSNDQTAIKKSNLDQIVSVSHHISVEYVV